MNTQLLKTFILAGVLQASFSFAALAQGTAFTYQGRLTDGGSAANGLYELRFTLYTQPALGVTVGRAVTGFYTVSNGLFTATLDFDPGAFNGNDRWLEIAVRPKGSASTFEVLSPRQPIMPTPYALLAGDVRDGAITRPKLASGAVGTAQLAAGAVNASNIMSGTITAAQLAPGAAAANLFASGQSGVAVGGVVMSPLADNTALAQAGYVKIGRTELIPESWSTNAPHPTSGLITQARTGHSAIWTGSEMIVWGGYNGSHLDDGLRYNPAANTWSFISRNGAPSARSGHTAVWGGSRMIVWSGGDSTGGRYNPTTDTWAGLSTAGAPTSRQGYAAVWAGNVMVVWGGKREGFYGPNSLYSGGRYNPSTDTWSAINTNSAPWARSDMAAVSTGTELLIWGGLHQTSSQEGKSTDFLLSGARYNPTTDQWTHLSMTDAPEQRHSADAVWTGTQMLVWGGIGKTNIGERWLNTGGRYNPSTDTWSAAAMLNAPEPRTEFTTVWTGSRMIVWGGNRTNYDSLNTGASYDPSANTWTSTATSGAPAARRKHTAVWTGSEMLVWGGSDGSYPHVQYLDGGRRYNPGANTWTAMAATPQSGQPGARRDASAVWTGSEVIVWGGEHGGQRLHTGARFDPAANAWTQLAVAGAPSGRTSHTAVWTGREMLVWGGHEPDYTQTGARYNPLLNSWLPINTSNAPVARANHTAVWTDSEMVIWGGQGPTVNEQLSFLADGGRYNPLLDQWSAVSTNHSLEPRSHHTAVWTGSEMVIWGGFKLLALGFPFATYYADGARYRPSNNTWVALPAGGPGARYLHTAVWTGSEMIVWGGRDTARTNSGGQYHLAGNVWSALNLVGAPAARDGHTAVWDGTQMLVWGGSGAGGALYDGGRYEPATATWTSVAGSSYTQKRRGHVAVWTSTELVICGGHNGTDYLDSCLSYTPARIMSLYLKP